MLCISFKTVFENSEICRAHAQRNFHRFRQYFSCTVDGILSYKNKLQLFLKEEPLFLTVFENSEILQSMGLKFIVRYFLNCC